MSLLSILIVVLLALVAVKLLLNLGMMIELGSYDPDGPDPPRGYSLMPVEPVPLLLASVLGLFRFDWWAEAVVLFVVGMVVIVASYPLGLVLGRLRYLWRR
ncbi:MAG: hypothetical protein J0L92_10745 [Deltaproteobacteria bacterium]|nr:hypothetical protein [Deltaproteobacteria bacterium]